MKRPHPTSLEPDKAGPTLYREAAMALRADIEGLLSESGPNAAEIIEEAAAAFGMGLRPGETKRGLWLRVRPRLDRIIAGDTGGSEGEDEPNPRFLDPA